MCLMSSASVDNICKKTNQPLLKSRHTPLTGKNRRMGRQNRSPGYHETTPQPKLTLLQSGLHLKTKQCLWLELNSDIQDRFFCQEKPKRTYKCRKRQKRVGVLIQDIGDPYFQTPASTDGERETLPVLECSQEVNLQLPVRNLLPESLMGACLKSQDAGLELSLSQIKEGPFQRLNLRSLRLLIYLAANYYLSTVAPRCLPPLEWALARQRAELLTMTVCYEGLKSVKRKSEEHHGRFQH